MKHNITLCAIIIFTALTVFSCGKAEKKPSSQGKTEQGKVRWLTFNEAEKLSSEKKQHMIVSFYADWCGWCRRMDSDVFSEKKISSILNENFSLARVYTDRDQAITHKGHKMTSSQFAGYFGVSGLPSTIFLDKDGDLITTIPGYIEASVMLPLLMFVDQECYKKNITIKDFINKKYRCE